MVICQFAIFILLYDKKKMFVSNLLCVLILFFWTLAVTSSCLIRPVNHIKWMFLLTRFPFPMLTPFLSRTGQVCTITCTAVLAARTGLCWAGRPRRSGSFPVPTPSLPVSPSWLPGNVSGNDTCRVPRWPAHLDFGTIDCYASAHGLHLLSLSGEFWVGKLTQMHLVMTLVFRLLFFFLFLKSGCRFVWVLSFDHFFFQIQRCKSRDYVRHS